MFTGDALESAEEIAALAGVEEVHAKLLPQDKLSEIQKIRENHGSGYVCRRRYQRCTGTCRS